MAGKILLVDDVTMFLEIQKSFLRGSSAQVFTARDGVEALEAVKKEPPDLIFMDLHMPNLDGAECCRRIKSNPAIRYLPVVLVTSAGRPEDHRECLSAGCDDFLSKPLDRDIFLDKARKFVPSIDRREKRVACRFPAKFRMFGITLSCTVLDVSMRGLYVAADYPVETKSALEISFVLPDAKQTPVNVQAKICWVNRGDGRMKSRLPPGFGLEFVAPPREVTEALKAFVAAAP